MLFPTLNFGLTGKGREVAKGSANDTKQGMERGEPWPTPDVPTGQNVA